jgi:hypothetical protein
MEQKTKIMLYLRQVNTLHAQHPELKELRATNFEEYESQMSEKLPKFKQDYPTLFKMMIREFDRPVFMSKLNHFLGLSQDVRNGRKTLEEASKQVGQEQYDEFVAPIVQHLPPKPATE